MAGDERGAARLGEEAMAAAERAAGEAGRESRGEEEAVGRRRVGRKGAGWTLGFHLEWSPKEASAGAASNGPCEKREA